MSGAIPSLSRGGSWQNLPEAGGGSASSGYGYTQGDSIFPRPSQIVPPPGPATASAIGNRNNGHFAQIQHPQHGWAAPMARHAHAQALAKAQSRHPPELTLDVGVGGSKSGRSVATASGRNPSVSGTPTRHPGWASLHAGGYRSSPSSPTSPRASAAGSAATTIAAQAAMQYGPFFRPTTQTHPWEWDSGSPKPMTAEPDYFSLPPASGYASVPVSPAAAGAQRMDSLPPPPKPAPQSPRPRIESHGPGRGHNLPKSALARPGISRRHTHDRYLPSAEHALSERSSKTGPSTGSKSLGRTRGKSGLSRSTPSIDANSTSIADGSYYSASGRATVASSSHPPSTAGSGTYPQSIDPPTTARSAPRSSRPTTPSRRTFSTTAPSTTIAGSTTASSSNLSGAKTLAERRLKNRPHPALSTIASTSTIDFTTTTTTQQQSTTSPSLFAPHTARTRAAALDMQSLGDALPPTPGTSTSMSLSMSATGYVPPTLDEDYDRYAAHPAAPVPPRADLAPEQLARVPQGPGLKQVTAENYRPPGFPKPVRSLGINRDGPAMRTHGIAWDREGTVDALPGGPAGPRWIQARPPVPAGQPSGNWWQAG